MLHLTFALWKVFFCSIFFHFYVGSVILMRLLHLARSCVSSLDNSLSDKSFLLLSNHLLFVLPLLLFPGTSITITLFPTYSSSLLNTCPYHFNLLSCTFLAISPTSNSFIPNSVQLGDSTPPHPTSSLVLSSPIFALWSNWCIMAKMMTVNMNGKN